MRVFSTLLGLCSLLLIATCKPDTSPEAWVESTLSELTLEQKVSQLFATQTRGFYMSEDDPEYRRLIDLVENFGIGGIIFSIGEPVNQALLTNDFQTRAGVPLLITQDMEWGVGMRLDRTTTFPRAMAVGATRDPDLAYRMGRVVAEEARALGIHQNYAPVADINNNPYNPIINVRSFGEDPELVSEMAAAHTRGLQAGGLLATAKHFPGHGDTDVDSHADLPVLPFSRERLDSLELRPFRAAIDAGVESIMVAHLAFPAIEPDSTVPSTLSPRVVNDILRRDLGFDGLVVTDALVMEGVTKHFGAGEAAVRALEAGIDHLLMPVDEYAARAGVLNAVASGRLSEEQIDESVRRVLWAKAKMGLGSNRLVDIDSLRSRINTNTHAALRNEIAQRSLTLLRNENELLPLLDPDQSILAITLNDGADPDAGQFFVDQLRTASGFPAIDHLLLDERSSPEDFASAITRASSYDVVLVPTFVRVRSWSGQIGLSTLHQDFLNNLIRRTPPVAVISFGNPYIVMGLDEPDVYIAAYGHSEGTQQAAAQALLGQVAFSGKLPVNIPNRYAYGDGLNLPQVALRVGVPEEVGMSSARLQSVDSLMRASISNQAFPGAAVAVGRTNVLVSLDGFGFYTYEAETPVTPQSIFDMASLTKVIATTTAVMQLYDQGRIDLDAPLAEYLPEFGQNGKEDVTVRQILTHTAGLIPYHRFYRMGVTTRQGVLNAIYTDPLEATPDSAYAYSDLGMIVLAEAISRITEMPFDAYCEQYIFAPLDMRNSGFREVRDRIDPTIVPTEIDNVFRNRLVQGEVHDETAWILGGTAGHAGLFSTAEDLAKFAQMILNGGTYNGRRLIEEETVRLFTTKVENTLDHTRALGWDTKSPEEDEEEEEYYSSAGVHFSPRSFGHTGFTGTSLWIDPDAELFVVLLTNRVYPTRNNRKHMDVRSGLADIAHEATIPPSAPPIVKRGDSSQEP